MAKDKDKSSKKTASASLDDMRDAFRRHKERSKGGGSSDNAWDKLDDGKNMRRILPRPKEKKFYTEGWTHFNVGPNQRAVRCIDEAKINDEKGLPESGTKCPICKKFLREQSRINSEYQKGDEDGRAEWKRAKDKYVPRHQFYVNTLVADSDGDVEVKILAFGMQIWSLLMNYYLGDDTQIGDFTDPESGRWMNIKREKKGRDRRNVEYKVFPASESSDISDAWDEIKDRLHDLEAAPGKLLSKDEIVAVLKGIDLNKGSGDDDDDDEDDDDDDDDDDTSSDSGSDDEDEEEEEEEEDDDDDDDRPSPKKSKLSMKMKKRREDD